jgi:RNA polymerase sigma factor (sigma-70 family)
MTVEDLNTHRDVVLRCCSAVLRRRYAYLIDDACQETFLRAWLFLELKHQEPVLSPEGFLATLARRTALNTRRAESRHFRQRHQPIDQETTMLDLESLPSRPDGLLMQVTLRDLFKDVFARLRSDRQREVLRYSLAGYCQSEIADRLGKSRSLINRDIKHIREVIMKLWSPDGDDPGGGRGGHKQRPSAATPARADAKDEKPSPDPVAGGDATLFAFQLPQLAALVCRLPAFQESEAGGGQQPPAVRDLEEIVEVLTSTWKADALPAEGEGVDEGNGLPFLEAATLSLGRGLGPWPFGPDNSSGGRLVPRLFRRLPGSLGARPWRPGGGESPCLAALGDEARQFLLRSLDDEPLGGPGRDPGAGSEQA